MQVLVEVIAPIVHVLACLFLIVVVLLQTGKGADMGAVLGGGGSQTLFGAAGAGNLLTKLTTGMAVTFMATSLILALGQTTAPTSGLLERLPEEGIEVPPPVAPDAATADVLPPTGEPAPAAEDAPPAPKDTAAAPDAASDEPATPPAEAAEAPAPSAPDDAAPAPSP